MSVRNHEFSYRPLIGGIEIINPANDRPGTLGAIATDGTRRFVLSCYHVLCRPNGAAFTDGEDVWQSVSSRNGGPIGKVFSANAFPQLDCAAALITTGVGSLGRIFGLGPLAAPGAPRVGMRLIKSGYSTGVTEGDLIALQGDRVEIRRPAGFPPLYEASDFGDSGALWVERDTSAPIAMHTGASPGGNAVAVSIQAVLTLCGLSLVRD